MKRKITQMVAVGSGLAVLCEDNTLWVLYDGKWNQAPLIPDSEKSEGSLADWEAGL